MLKKLLCFIGYHNWSWTLKREGIFCEPLPLGVIPDMAICKRCGVKYGK